MLKALLRAKIWPKSGENGRQKGHFFYAGAAAENLSRRKSSRYTPRQIYCTSYQLFCGERGKHNAFPQNSFPARAVCHKESFAREFYQGFQLTRAAKIPSVEKWVCAGYGWRGRAHELKPTLHVNFLLCALAKSSGRTSTRTRRMFCGRPLCFRSIHKTSGSEHK